MFVPRCPLFTPQLTVVSEEKVSPCMSIQPERREKKKSNFKNLHISNKAIHNPKTSYCYLVMLKIFIFLVVSLSALAANTLATTDSSNFYLDPLINNNNNDESGLLYTLPEEESLLGLNIQEGE